LGSSAFLTFFTSVFGFASSALGFSSALTAGFLPIFFSSSAGFFSETGCFFGSSAGFL
jgi:hypothetical protein